MTNQLAGRSLRKIKLRQGGAVKQQEPASPVRGWLALAVFVAALAKLHWGFRQSVTVSVNRQFKAVADFHFREN